MPQSDFLSDGQPVPEGSAYKSMTSQTVLPDWYTNYAMQLLSDQKAVSAQPYQTYQAPRTAGFNQTQQQGFDMTKGAAGAYQPYLSTANNMSRTAGSIRSLDEANPYYAQATAINPSAIAGSDYDAARASISTAGGMNPGQVASTGFDAARGAMGTAAGFDPSRAASGDFGASRGGLDMALGFNPLARAQPGINSAMGMNGVDAAMPWLQRGGGTVEDVSSYMNPYDDAVVDYIGDVGARNLSEKLLPSIEGRYIAGGQWGDIMGGDAPSGYMTDTVRAVRDTNRDILGQQAQLRQSGYLAAQGAKAGDLSRQTNIGTTLGNLTQGQQDILMRGGTALGGFEQAQQAATLDAARQRAALGTAEAGFEQSQQQAMLDIARQNAALGQAEGGFEQAQQAAALAMAQQQAAMGTNAAGIAQSQQTFLGNMGTNAGTLAGNDAARLLEAAQVQGGLGSAAQSMGLTGAGALSDIGSQQQTLDQKNLDTAYADYLRQQGWSQQQIDAQLATMKAVAPGVPTATTEQGIVPVGGDQQYGPSTAGKIAAGLTGGAALIDAIGKL